MYLQQLTRRPPLRHVTSLANVQIPEYSGVSLSDCCVVTWRAVPGSAVTNETRYMSADDPLGQPTVILPRVQDVEYGETLLQAAARPCSSTCVCSFEVAVVGFGRLWGRKGKGTARLHRSPKQASQHPVLWKTGSVQMT